MKNADEDQIDRERLAHACAPRPLSSGDVVAMQHRIEERVARPRRWRAGAMVAAACVTAVSLYALWPSGAPTSFSLEPIEPSPVTTAAPLNDWEAEILLGADPIDDEGDEDLPDDYMMLASAFDAE